MDNGADCTTWAANGPWTNPGDNLKVKFEPDADKKGYFYLKFKQGLYVHNHTGTNANGNKITQWEKVKQDNLLWRFELAEPR